MQKYKLRNHKINQSLFSEVINKKPIENFDLKQKRKPFNSHSSPSAETHILKEKEIVASPKKEALTFFFEPLSKEESQLGLITDEEIKELRDIFSMPLNPTQARKRKRDEISCENELKLEAITKEDISTYQYNLGIDCLQNGETLEAYNMFKNAAFNNHPLSYCKLFYLYQKLTPPSDKKVLILSQIKEKIIYHLDSIQKFFDEGYLDAKFDLALCSLQGFKKEIDRKFGVQLLKQIANEFPLAALFLADIYCFAAKNRSSQNSQSYLSEGIIYLRIAAKNNYEEAKQALANLSSINKDGAQITLEKSLNYFSSIMEQENKKSVPNFDKIFSEKIS